MKTERITKLLIVLISTVFVTQNASATAPLYLPDCSHYQGRSYFDFGPLSGRIDFAVYDTVTYPDELIGAGGRNEDLPWWDDMDTEENNLAKYRYIYAYQIFVDDTSTDIIDYFAILGLGDGSVVKDPSTDEWPIGSMDDIITIDGVAPDEDPYPASSSEYGLMVVWEFAGGYLVADDHSWFLILGSDHDWTYGGYTFNKTIADEVPLPNPEPASMALFGLGAVLTFTRKRKRALKT